MKDGFTYSQDCRNCGSDVPASGEGLAIPEGSQDRNAQARDVTPLAAGCVADVHVQLCHALGACHAVCGGCCGGSDGGGRQVHGRQLF